MNVNIFVIELFLKFWKEVEIASTQKIFCLISFVRSQSVIPVKHEKSTVWIKHRHIRWYKQLKKTGCLCKVNQLFTRDQISGLNFLWLLPFEFCQRLCAHTILVQICKNSNNHLYSELLQCACPELTYNNNIIRVTKVSLVKHVWKEN